jgi:hypothetical protein
MKVGMDESEICFWIIGVTTVCAMIFENFLEGNNYSLVPIFNSLYREVLLNKKQMFHCQLM